LIRRDAGIAVQSEFDHEGHTFTRRLDTYSITALPLWAPSG
jgi:hypothetical protein